MNKGLWLLVLLAFFTFISGFLSLTQTRANDYKVFKIGHSMDVDHSVHKALMHFREELEEISDNRLRVEIYASGQLGSERDLVELVQIGSLTMTKVSVAALESFVPDLQVFNLPYVFRDNEHYWKVLQSEIGKELLNSTEKVRVKGLAYYDAGSRSFYTCDKPVYTPDDLRGLKIRTIKSKTAVALMSELGASATPIAFGELYTAMQQGVVDGAENNAITYFKSRHYEICKYYSRDRHNSPPDIIIIGSKLWASLSHQERGWVRHAMDSSVTFQKTLWKEDTEKALSALRERGVTIIEPDQSLFFERVKKFKIWF